MSSIRIGGVAVSLRASSSYKKEKCESTKSNTQEKKIR